MFFLLSEIPSLWPGRFSLVTRLANAAVLFYSPSLFWKKLGTFFLWMSNSAFPGEFLGIA